ASDATITDIIHFVQGRRPVSAALGEFRDRSTPYRGTGLAFAKWGLAGRGDDPSWERDLAAAGQRLRQAAPHCQAVAVAYADWRQAEAPALAAVLHFLREHGWQTLLVDTWHKDGKTLLDWLALDEIVALCERCREAAIRVALAGALGPRQI